jgi:hypothetical protein
MTANRYAVDSSGRGNHGIIVGTKHAKADRNG